MQLQRERRCVYDTSNERAKKYKKRKKKKGQERKERRDSGWSPALRHRHRERNENGMIRLEPHAAVRAEQSEGRERM